MGERDAPGPVVTIDGPAGSGKSTIARALATRLHVPHVDTGAFYRAATLAVLHAGVDVRDALACARVVGEADIARAQGRTLLEGEDVEAEIRGSAVTAAVSAVSAHPPVRTALLARQRAAISRDGAVVEGRDAGTAVAPWADLKVWLTASIQERSLRRSRQLGLEDADDIAAYAADLERRDAEDRGQMAPAPDAVTVDTTERGVGEIVDEIAALLARLPPASAER